jgi:hypothetical protein
MDHDKIDITDAFEDWFEELSPERMELLRMRVERATRDLYDEDEALAAAENEMKKMFAGDALDRLVDDGLIEASNINDDGELEYSITETGKGHVQEP